MGLVKRVRGAQAVTALAWAEGGRLLVSAGADTLAAAWQLLDLLDAPAAQAPPAPLFSWCGALAPRALAGACIGCLGVMAMPLP